MGVQPPFLLLPFPYGVTVKDKKEPFRMEEVAVIVKEPFREEEDAVSIKVKEEDVLGVQEEDTEYQINTSEYCLKQGHKLLLN